MPQKKTETLPPLSYIISVALEPECYRHIRIGADETLDKLSRAILKAFEFDNDHLHVFFMDNRPWSQNPSDCFWSDDESAEEDSDNPPTYEVTLRELHLRTNRKFLYLFDFGDEWRFSCQIVKTLHEETKKPAVVLSVGDAPPQYGEEDWDDEEDEEMDDEEFTPIMIHNGVVTKLPTIRLNGNQKTEKK